MTPKEYCPECILELKKQSKKLGCYSSYLVCPSCGFRTRAKSEFVKNKELEEFYKEKNRINNKLQEDE
jgi:hypothetical protein